MIFLAYKGVDNYQTIMLYLMHETFSHTNAWPIHLSKLYGLSTTNPYGWIKPGDQDSFIALLTIRIKALRVIFDASKVSVYPL